MDHRVEIKPLHEIINNLFERTLNVCQRTGMLSALEIEDVQIMLKKEGLSANQIEKDLENELKNLCLYEYQDVTQGSNRFQGKGYSSYKIEENMKIFLKERLTKFATLVSLKKNIKPLSLEKSFQETLQELLDK